MRSMSTAAGNAFPFSDLDERSSKSRYGVAYVRALCGQAGVSSQETSPDEDGKAIDLTVDFCEAGVGVQVKCSSTFRINGGATATWPAEHHWITKWNSRMTPVYCVLVLVDPIEQARWLDHRADGTWHRSAAFWTRVNHLRVGDNIVFDKRHRLTVQTFAQWHKELLDAFRP